jgi:hypothetical protein
MDIILNEALRVARKQMVLVEPNFVRHCGIKKSLGYWDFARMLESLQKRNLRYTCKEFPTRINPFVQLNVVEILL